MKIIAFLIELFGWAKIVISPTLGGALIGGIIFYNNQNETGIMIGASLTFLGFIIGIIWATSIWRKNGNTTAFLSRTYATPELDKKD